MRVLLNIEVKSIDSDTCSNIPSMFAYLLHNMFVYLVAVYCKDLNRVMLRNISAN